MNLLYLPIGAAIGFAVAAPVGPVNLICINRGLAYGALSALAVGSGAAVGDAVFAIFAAFGFATFTDMIAASRDPIRLVGGLIMIGFAYFVWRAQPAELGKRQDFIPAWRQAVATFFMTVTNPATLMGFTAIFAGTGFKKLGISSAEHIANSTALVLGVWLGSMLWWLGDSFVAGRLKRQVSNKTLVRINHVSAVVLGLFGIAAMVAGLID
ncbi:MAG: LysE family translocator [Sphingomonadales bacterium]